MRIVFLGLPLACILLASDGHDIVLAGLRADLSLGGRRLRRLIGSDRVVLAPDNDWEDFGARVGALSPDLLVSWFFTRRIPLPLVEMCRLGGVGVHPSILPRHRGPDPFFAAIDAGDKETGVTAHRIAAAYDEGEILATRALAIDPSWNAWNLAKALDRPSLALLREVVGRASQGDDLAGNPQEESLATYAPQPNDEMRVVRWDRPADAIARRVRALAPWPGAVAWVGDTCITITQATTTRHFPKALLPGEATVVEGTAVVRASDDAVVLLEGRIDDNEVDASEIAKVVERARAK